MCGARCAVSGVRCAVRGARSAVRGARCAVCGARCAVCGVRCAVGFAAPLRLIIFTTLNVITGVINFDSNPSHITSIALLHLLVVKMLSLNK